MATCSGCKDEFDNGKVLCCDTCKKHVCYNCADLSASELKCMPLRNRKLKFLCEECEKGLSQIPIILKQIAEMKEEIEKLKEAQKHTNMDLITQENTISEMLDRQNRRSNIIVLNIKEPQQNSGTERAAEDKDTIKKLFDNINVNLENLRTFRLGKFVAGKNRPLKVILSSPEEAIKILKNKNAINVPSVVVFGDQTKMQRDYFLKVKKELEELITTGDNSKTIKYINNRPTIISKTTVTRQKN